MEAKLIGVIKMLDDGEADDKLIAVLPGTDLWQVNSMTDLQTMYGGITEILAAWFENYKGPGVIQVVGFGDVNEANLILQQAMAAYQ